MPKHRRKTVKSAVKSAVKSEVRRAVTAGVRAPSRLRRAAFLCLWIFLGGSLTAAVVLTVAAALVFVAPPVPMEPISAEDAQLQQRILGKVSGEVFNRRPPLEASLRLKPDEVNALLRFMVFAVTAAEQFGTIEPRYAEIVRQGHYTYRPGVFTVELPLYRRHSRPFRGAAVLRVEGFPSKYDGKVDFALRSCRFGRIPLSATWAGEYANRELAALSENEDLMRLDRAIKSFEVESNGDVTVVYRPPELLRLLVGRGR